MTGMFEKKVLSAIKPHVTDAYWMNGTLFFETNLEGLKLVDMAIDKLDYILPHKIYTHHVTTDVENMVSEYSLDI